MLKGINPGISWLPFANTSQVRSHLSQTLTWSTWLPKLSWVRALNSSKVGIRGASHDGSRYSLLPGPLSNYTWWVHSLVMMSQEVPVSRPVV